MTTPLSQGRSFYQAEPLIARLRGIIRDYPGTVLINYCFIKLCF
ncbi:MAG: hypothetical protein ACLFSH_03350 [Phormidium sp.]